MGSTFKEGMFGSNVKESLENWKGESGNQPTNKKEKEMSQIVQTLTAQQPPHQETTASINEITRVDHH